MNKYYKNVSGGTVNVELFGFGVIHAPAEAQSVELSPDVVRAINDMAKPRTVFEEVSGVFKPVVMSTSEEGAVNVEQELPPAVDYSLFTNKKLIELCEALGIPVHRNANKAELLDLLGVGEPVEH